MQQRKPLHLCSAIQNSRALDEAKPSKVPQRRFGKSKHRMSKFQKMIEEICSKHSLKDRVEILKRIQECSVCFNPIHHEDFNSSVQSANTLSARTVSRGTSPPAQSLQGDRLPRGRLPRSREGGFALNLIPANVIHGCYQFCQEQLLAANASYRSCVPWFSQRERSVNFYSKLCKNTKILLLMLVHNYLTRYGGKETILKANRRRSRDILIQQKILEVDFILNRLIILYHQIPPSGQHKEQGFFVQILSINDQRYLLK